MMNDKYLVFVLALVVVLVYPALASLAGIFPATLMRSRDNRRQCTRMIAQIGQDLEWGSFGRNAMPKYIIAAIARNNESSKSNEEGRVVSFSELKIAATGDVENKPLYLTDIRRDPKALGWGYLGNVTSLYEFKKALTKRSSESGQDILLYVPSNFLSAKQVFRDCRRLSRAVRVITVPCIYPTVQEVPEKIFGFSWTRLEELSPAYLSRNNEGTKAFAEAVNGVLKGIDSVRVNCLAHGNGASLFNAMKSFGTPKTKFKNLFLVAPNLDYDLLATSPRNQDCRSTGKFITQVTDKLHIIYNADDRYLQAEKLDKGIQRLGYRGTDDIKIPASKNGISIHQGNAQGFVSFADPFRHHFYVTSNKLLRYFKREVDLSEKKLKVD